MKHYKPEYLGKVIPADNTTKLTDFVQNKFDSFNKIYDSCKADSEKIADIKTVDSSSSNASALSVKISADDSVIEQITNRVQDNESITNEGDVITAEN